MSDRVVLSALRLSWGGAGMLLSPYGVYRIIVPVFFFRGREAVQLSLSVGPQCMLHYGWILFAALCLSLSLAVSFHVPSQHHPHLHQSGGQIEQHTAACMAIT